MIDLATQSVLRECPSHGRGRRFNPCIAHHRNQALSLISAPAYSAGFSEHRQNTARKLGRNPGALFPWRSRTPVPQSPNLGPAA
jgi:hypothetical protein